MIKAVIFDFDGVIVESANIKTDAFVEVFREYPRYSEKILNYHKSNMGISRFVKFRYFYENLLKQEYTDEIGQKLSEDFSKIVIDKIIEAPFVKGAKEFLDRHSHKVMCFIASATPEREMIHIAKEKGITNYFEGIFGSPRAKDEIIDYILEKYSLKKEEVIFVGDAQSDYDAAKTADIRFIGRLTDDCVFPSDVVGIHDLTSLSSAIGKLWRTVDI